MSKTANIKFVSTQNNFARRAACCSAFTDAKYLRGSYRMQIRMRRVLSFSVRQPISVGIFCRKSDLIRLIVVSPKHFLRACAGGIVTCSDDSNFNLFAISGSVALRCATHEIMLSKN
jgi:hypothetical protein